MKRWQVWVLVLLLGASSAQSLSPAQQLFDAALETLRANYYGYSHFDAAAAQQSLQPQLNAACQGRSNCDFATANSVLRQMAQSLNDPHTYYLNADETRLKNLEFSGAKKLGVGMKLAAVPDATALVITRVLQGGPADTAGVRRGDLIWAIGHQPMSAFVSADAALKSISQFEAAGSPLELTLGRGKTRLEVILKPQLIEAWLPQLERRGNAGIISFFQFTPSGQVAARVHQLVIEAQRGGMTSLVLDVRDCEGGLVTEMLGAVGAFVEHPVFLDKFQTGTVRFEFFKGNFVQTDSDGQRLETPLLSSSAHWAGPVTVLTNRAAKSAPEYLAFLLQREAEASVVGEPTLGALNTSNGFFALPGNSSLAVTLGRSTLPDGTPFPERVKPDALISDDLTDLAVGLDAPLELALRGSTRPASR